MPSRKEANLELVRAMYNEFNRIYFAGRLPNANKINFIFRNVKGKMGHCNYNNHDQPEILLSSFYHCDSEKKLKINNLHLYTGTWTATLRHEMMHLYDHQSGLLKSNQSPHCHGFEERMKLINYRVIGEYELIKTYK